MHRRRERAIDWDHKWHAPGSRILPNGNYHGIGFIWTLAWRHMPGSCSVGMMMRADGTVNILARANDIGVCSPTACVQIVADELGLKYEHVTMRHDKDVKFSVPETAGSMGSLRTFPAMIRAARNLRKTLLEYAVTPASGGLMNAPAPARFPGKKPEGLKSRTASFSKKPTRPPASKCLTWQDRFLTAWAPLSSVGISLPKRDGIRRCRRWPDNAISRKWR